MMMQQLYINCYDQQQAMMPFAPQFSPYQQQDPSLSTFYRTAPMAVPMPVPTSLPMFISPNSSGRFDGGYDSSGASPTGFPGFAVQQQPLIYSQAPAYLPPPPPVTAAPPMLMLTPPQQSPPQPQQSSPAAAEPAVVWRDKFLENFSRFPIGLWQLKVVSEPPDVHNSNYARHLWRYHLDKARVNFLCKACHNSTSSTGQAVFWIYKDDFTNTGHIHMKLYGQKCPQCQSPAEPMWHPREAGRALDTLYDHVAQIYYGVQPTAAQQRSRNRRQSRASSEQQQQQQTRLQC